MNCQAFAFLKTLTSLIDTFQKLKPFFYDIYRKTAERIFWSINCFFHRRFSPTKLLDEKGVDGSTMKHHHRRHNIFYYFSIKIQYIVKLLPSVFFSVSRYVLFDKLFQWFDYNSINDWNFITNSIWKQFFAFVLFHDWKFSMFFNDFVTSTRDGKCQKLFCD